MHVKFDPSPPAVHYCYVWNYAYHQARTDIWMQAARDRDRFQQRIKQTSMVIEPILRKRKYLD